MLRAGPAVALLAGTSGLAVFVTARPAPIAVPWGMRLAIFGVGAMALWLGIVSALGEGDSRSPSGRGARFRRLFDSLAFGARRAWVGALPLAGLPATLALAPARAAWAVPALLVASALGLCLAEVYGPRGDPQRALLLPGLARSETAGAGVGGWEVGSLLFCLCATGWFFVVAWHTEGNADNDAAYYFGVARHIVRTGRFEEPIVWHFLAPPASVLHSPFDYWQGLTTIVLLPAMALFGPTSRVALLTMAGIAGTGLVLLWYLIAVAAPLRHRFAQAVALVAFAGSAALKELRFDTETVPVFHVVLLGALVALARGRVLLAACVAFCLYLTRGDGIVLCGLIWGACLFSLRSDEQGIPPRRALALLGTIALLIAAHGVWCLALYRVPVPPGARVGSMLTQYLDLYRWGTAPSLMPWRVRLDLASLAPKMWMAWDNLRTTPFLPEQTLFAGLTLAIGWRGAQWRFTGLLWLLLFVGSGLVAIAVGVVFSPFRTLYSMAPLVVLAVAAAVDALLASFERWQLQSPRPRALLLLMATALLALVGLPLTEIRPYSARPTDLAGVEHDLRMLTPLLHGEVLASMYPFSAIAVTDSPAIMIPIGDDAKLEQAFRRYRVRWLVLSATPCFEDSETICRDILQDKKASLGRLRLARTKALTELTLFRVDEAPGADAAPPVVRARRARR